ncbi:MAG: prolipoprotein diacylglyceryl transferase [Anaeromyxobacter sp.]
MLPVLFHLSVPLGWGLPLYVVLALVVLVGRGAAWLWRARQDGQRLSLVEAVKADGWLAAILAVLGVVLWRMGLLDRSIDLPLHTYGLLIASAFLLGIWLAQREARRRGQDPERIADLAFWILIAAVVGSELYFIGVNWREYFGPGQFWGETPLGRWPRFLIFWKNGLVFYGGFIGAALTAWWYMRRHRMPFLAHADTMIPSVAIGHFLGRLGCFGAGCCWGGPMHSDLPWAAHFPPESLAYQTFLQRSNPGQYLEPGGLSTIALHPTQLYESFGELGLFLLLVLWVRPRKRFHGQVLASWLIGYAFLRSAVELFRGDVERGVYLGLGAGQWTSIVILAVGVALWLRAPRPAVPEAAPAAG